MKVLPYELMTKSGGKGGQVTARLEPDIEMNN